MIKWLDSKNDYKQKLNKLAQLNIWCYEGFKDGHVKFSLSVKIKDIFEMFLIN